MMEPLLSPSGLARLAFLANGRSLYAFDFDGTLAPIRERPEDVRIESSLARKKLSLLASMAPVAIITGRCVDDLRGRHGFVPRAVVGNHGPERRAGLRADSRWVDVLTPLRVRLLAMRDDFSRVGMLVEDKLQSIAFHYRGALDADAAGEAISRALVPPLQGLRRFEGKRVVNLVADWVTLKVGPEWPSGARFSLEDQAQIGPAMDCILQAMSA